MHKNYFQKRKKALDFKKKSLVSNQSIKELFNL